MKDRKRHFEYPMEFPSHENRADSAPVLDEPADPELIAVEPRHQSGVHIERFTSVTPQGGQTADTECQTTL